MAGVRGETQCSLAKQDSHCDVRHNVDVRYRGQGLGSALVADAVLRALKSDLAAFALVVDAKDEAAVTFYEHAGFFVLHPADRVFMLPLANLRSELEL